MLVEIWSGAVYQLVAGLFLVKVYDRWNEARPWRWYAGWASGLTPAEIKEAALVWVALLVVTVAGLYSAWLRPAMPTRTAARRPRHRLRFDAGRPVTAPYLNPGSTSYADQGVIREPDIS
jgi:hypothetical protein